MGTVSQVESKALPISKLFEHLTMIINHSMSTGQTFVKSVTAYFVKSVTAYLYSSVPYAVRSS